MNIPDRIIISKFDRRVWRLGGLHEKLALKYPMLIDADDLRLARNQFPSGSHFTEWMAAIELYKRYGYKSLIEKYEFSGHPKKAEVLKKLGVEIKRFKHCQYPDLLVYDAAGNWEFVEIKSRKDSLSSNQLAYFPRIERLFGKSIKILKLLET
jgi:hypothetical protein